MDTQSILLSIALLVAAGTAQCADDVPRAMKPSPGSLSKEDVTIEKLVLPSSTATRKSRSPRQVVRTATIKERPTKGGDYPVETKREPAAIALTQGPALLAAARETSPVINRVFTATTKASFAIAFALMSIELSKYIKGIEKHDDQAAFSLTLEQELLPLFKRFHKESYAITTMQLLSLSDEEAKCATTPLTSLLAELKSQSPAFATALSTNDPDDFRTAFPKIKILFTPLLESIEEIYGKEVMRTFGRNVEDAIIEQEKNLGIAKKQLRQVANQHISKH